MIMELHKLRLETGGSPVVHKWRVFLDDKDISGSVRGIEIKGRIGELAIVKLEMVTELGDIEIFELRGDED